MDSIKENLSFLIGKVKTIHARCFTPLVPVEEKATPVSGESSALLATKLLIRKLEGKIEALEQHGFKKVKPEKASYSTGFIMVNEELGVVVKRPYTLLAGVVPKCAVETVILDWPISMEEKEKLGCSWPQTETYNQIFIQHLVDTSEEARQQAEKVISKIREKGQDSHQWNIGLFKGQVVAFDW